MCTLKNFPHAIEHCIEWSRDIFEGYFSDTPKEVNNFLADPNTYLQRLPSMGNVAVQKDKLEKISDYMKLLNEPTFENCVRAARFKMQDLFHDTIA
mmetsp:Transcript_13099/g.1999  ORF Transcript_13099/g.1999 Transcript_13099/m.1999 type:complete len:96 (-) Transcript_13099:1055-1342(-)